MKLLALSALASLVACSGPAAAPPPVAVTPPQIASFSATPASIVSGQGSTLDWSVSAATTLSLDQGLGPVTGASRSVSPTTTTTYTLTAANAAGSVTAAATVAVSAAPTAPTIASFAATPAAILIGQSSALTWSVSGATTVRLDQGIGPVTGNNRSVSPTATTTYTLTATNAQGSVTAAATVAVSTAPPKPVIASFTATPDRILGGQSSALAWSVSGATTLSLDQGVGAVTGTSKSVSPTATTTYTLTATNDQGSVTATATVALEPAGPRPLIASFSADASYVLHDASTTTLRWSVANATRVSLDNGVGVVTATRVQVAPTATTTYVLTASRAAGSATASITITVGPDSSAFTPPGNPGGAPALTLTLDAQKGVHPISRFIYGYNASAPSAAPVGTTLLRLGGNRWTAYNWETNASNAGSDYLYENDNYLSASATAGEAMRPTIAAAQAANQGTLITLPMQGWVSADESGPVSTTTPGSLQQRFRQTLPRKGSAFVYPPDTTDQFVYQDEAVSFLVSQLSGATDDETKPLFFALDNEPDLWSSTHAEVQRTPLTYAALEQRSVDLAAAIKAVAPTAKVFGPASYGYNGYVNLQQASDASGSAWSFPPATAPWFLDDYLARLRTASEAQGLRLLDVLDLHWYSEATDGGTRITTSDSSAAVALARVHAPRSLWDPSYSCLSGGTAPVGCEESWVAKNFSPNGNLSGAIALLPALRGKIAAGFPGTRLAFSEYNYGAPADISGALAQADVLGILGRDDVYAATFWPLDSSAGGNRFIYAAFRLFRDYDGAAGAFGDTSFSALSSDPAKASVYAAYDAAAPLARVVVVAINRGTAPLPVQLRLTAAAAFSHAQVYQLTSASAYNAAAQSVIPTHLADLTGLSGNAFNATLPASSATTYVLLP